MEAKSVPDMRSRHIPHTTQGSNNMVFVLMRSSPSQGQNQTKASPSAHSVCTQQQAESLGKKEMNYLQSCGKCKSKCSHAANQSLQTSLMLVMLRLHTDAPLHACMHTFFICFEDQAC